MEINDTIHTDATSRNQPTFKGLTLQDLNQYSVPSEQESILLLDQFFAGVGTILPCFDKQAILATLSHVHHSGTRSAERSTRALINVMFAHATIASRPTDAEVFYRRSLANLPEWVLRSATIELG